MNSLTEISTPAQEKKEWVSPELNPWELSQLENLGGVGPDGLLQTYTV